MINAEDMRTTGQFDQYREWLLKTDAVEFFDLKADDAHETIAPWHVMALV